MYEWQNIKLEEALSLVQSRNPIEFSWGYYSNDTHPQGGVGSFSWFESRDELLDYLVSVDAQIWSYSAQGLDEEAYTEMKKAIQKILKEADSNRELTDSLRKRISKHLSEQLMDVEISWWGKFSDLCSGKDAFSREFIDWFFDDYGEYSEDKKPKTVTAEHIPEFIEFCKEFGH